jgi:lipoyl(octanoyl) transferase
MLRSPAHDDHLGFDLAVRDLGRMPYAEGLELQRRLQREVISSRGDSPDALARRAYLLLVEHVPPVITISRRRSARTHLVATPDQLAAAGIEVAETDRGGDITYHGPGQLVVYPIIDLNLLRLRLHGYMRFLEQIVIETLAHFGIEGQRDSEATGVWVDPKRRNESDDAHGFESVGASSTRGLPSPPAPLPEEKGSRDAKICAMGVRISRWVTMHGLALNVTTNLAHFDLIVPCGLSGRSVTSVRDLLADACPSMDQVKQAFVEQFREAVKGHL